MFRPSIGKNWHRMKKQPHEGGRAAVFAGGVSGFFVVWRGIL